MLKKILIVVAVLVIGLGVLIYRKPTSFHIVRAISIAAPVSDIFPQINEPKKMDVWSPWSKVDPAMTKTFEGPESGVGAVQKWSGNREAGEGIMTIVDVKDGEYVRYKLEFIKPFPSTAGAEFTFKPEGDKTVVAWNMYGENKHIAARIFAFFFDCDKMVGGEFEKGLAALKALVEAGGR